MGVLGSPREKPDVDFAPTSAALLQQAINAQYQQVTPTVGATETPDSGWRLLPTFTPEPTNTRAPEIVRTYGQLDGYGNTWEVQVWSSGGTTQKIVQTAVPTARPTAAPACAFSFTERFTLTSRASRYWYWDARAGNRLRVQVEVFTGAAPFSAMRFYDSKKTKLADLAIDEASSLQELVAPYSDRFTWDVYNTFLSPQKTYQVNVWKCDR